MFRAERMLRLSYEEAYSDSLRAAHAFIAQLVERFVYTEDVGGSSPSGGTNGESRWLLAVSTEESPDF